MYFTFTYGGGCSAIPSMIFSTLGKMLSHSFHLWFCFAALYGVMGKGKKLNTFDTLHFTLQMRCTVNPFQSKLLASFLA